MSNDTETPFFHVDREAAAKLNPLMSEESVFATCLTVSAALQGWAWVIDMNTGEDVESQTFMGALRDQVEVFAAALDFEAQPAKSKPKEAPVKLVE